MLVPPFILDWLQTPTSWILPCGPGTVLDKRSNRRVYRAQTYACGNFLVSTSLTSLSSHSQQANSTNQQRQLPPLHNVSIVQPGMSRRTTNLARSLDTIVQARSQSLKRIGTHRIPPSLTTLVTRQTQSRLRHPHHNRQVLVCQI